MGFFAHTAGNLGLENADSPSSRIVRLGSLVLVPVSLGDCRILLKFSTCVRYEFAEGGRHAVIEINLS